MSRALAIVRANWLTALSYRLETMFQFLGLFVMVVPLYFVSHALQPMMATTIKTEAPEYFGFLIVGWVALSFVNTAVTGLHGALSGEISTGSFEALLSTPTSLPALLAGLIGHALTMNILRAVAILSFATIFGLHIVWSSALTGVGILFLILLAYLPFGIVAAALVLGFRTTGPFPTLDLYRVGAARRRLLSDPGDSVVAGAAVRAGAVAIRAEVAETHVARRRAPVGVLCGSRRPDRHDSRGFCPQHRGVHAGAAILQESRNPGAGPD